jgi:CheY-like chemotaxis protein
MFARFGEAGRSRPNVVIAHTQSTYVNSVERAFRRHGWGIVRAADGPEVRRLFTKFQPSLVILEAEFPGESGWLTCAKLAFGDADARTILVGDEPSDFERDFADFVGAVRLVATDEGVEPLLEEAGLIAAVS